MDAVGKDAKVARHAGWVYCLFLLVRYLLRMEVNSRLRHCGRGRLGAIGLPFSEMEKFKLRLYHYGRRL